MHNLSERMHAHDSILQTHELTYTTGQGNARSHLWEFSTWRSVCRGLLVTSNQILQACPLIFVCPVWLKLLTPSLLVFPVKHKEVVSPLCYCPRTTTNPSTRYPPTCTRPGLLPHPRLGPPVTQRLASCIPRGHFPKAKGKMLTTSSPGPHPVALRASAFSSWGHTGRGAQRETKRNLSVLDAQNKTKTQPLSNLHNCVHYCHPED